MPTTEFLYELPVCSTGFTTEASFEAAYNSTVTYSYVRDDKIVQSGLRFLRTVAVCQHFEPVCSVWRLDAYDKLLEITNSDWVNELNRIMPSDVLGDLRLRHFLIYFDSIGSIEVVATGWELIEEEAE